ncbi:hypothetical protein [Micromonospora sp. RTGN7]|uniref:hypothetical protein n=1 Tax=Micromonospora sp. RTGN7 TaxID=3016526 RepID=UPI0029FF1D6C|nr:hypothetical protein [Micromonospora sp. RTGN7]
MSHAVQVDEAAIGPVEGGRWWAMFRRYEMDGRIRTTAGLAEVACESRAHAEWLAAHMVDHGGLPRTAVRVIPAGAVAGAAHAQTEGEAQP